MSPLWSGLLIKVAGWLRAWAKDPETYWKAKDYLEEKERERSQKIIDDINNRKH